LTEETLRRWMNGELSPSESREVARWIVRCTSPELGPLLRALAREREEAEADRTLLSFAPHWRALVEKWIALLTTGAAGWTSPDAGLVLASLAPETASSWCRLRESDDGVQVIVDGDPDLEVAIYLTADDARARRVVPPTDYADVTWPILLEQVGADRPTLWTVRGRSLPRDPDPLTELLAALDRDDVEVRALRWDEVEP
jgi:hypothetical protein